MGQDEEPAATPRRRIALAFGNVVHADAGKKFSQRQGWSEQFAVHRRRGVQMRTYCFNVASTQVPTAVVARLNGLARPGEDQEAEDEGQITTRMLDMRRVPDPTTAPREVSTEGARPLARSLVWPVLIATRTEPLVVHPGQEFYDVEKKSTAIVPQDGWKRKKLERTRATRLEAVVTSKNGLIAAASRGYVGKSLKPFCAGTVRPRILEADKATMLGPADPNEAIDRRASRSREDELDGRLSPAQERHSPVPVLLTVPKSPGNDSWFSNSPGGNSPLARTPDSSPRSSRHEEKRARGGQKRRTSNRAKKESDLPPPPKPASEEVSSKLERLKVTGRKKLRMKNIRDRRKEQIASLHGESRHAVNEKSSVEAAAKAFERHFAPRGYRHCPISLLEAVADFGIKATTRQQRIELLKLSREMFEEEDATELDLEDFTSFIEEARNKLRFTTLTQSYQLCRQKDEWKKGTVSSPDLYQLFVEMEIAPETQDEEDVVEVLIEELNAEVQQHGREPEKGCVNYDGADFLFQHLRELKCSTVRAKERRIVEEHGLENVEDLRSQLLVFHDTFYEHLQLHETAELEFEPALVDLLSEFGLLIHGPDMQKLDGQEFIYDILQEKYKSFNVDFEKFLRVVQALRRDLRDRLLPEVKSLFEEHDRDKSGKIDSSELWSILEVLDMQPQEATQQQDIVDVLLDVDSYATGKLSLQQLACLLQRVSEKIVRGQRAREMQHGLRLGWSKLQVLQFRRAFEELDEELTSEVPLSFVQKAVVMMEWKITQARLERMLIDADDDGSGTINFLEFLTLMTRIDVEIRKDDDSPRETKVKKRTQALPTANMTEGKNSRSSTTQNDTSPRSGSKEPHPVPNERDPIGRGRATLTKELAENVISKWLPK
eukprot:TRINITY_DN90889_c0_g1_i1.p1 TRINITY_DN90889_c0_g1~~TRINITY_DN90889_c0_g1_i1.p1  ORF type:complete len:888 (+),score=233.27 TRINITY_DN90889_c0_g1_i1:149-2812(+)